MTNLKEVVFNIKDFIEKTNRSPEWISKRSGVSDEDISKLMNSEIIEVEKLEDIASSLRKNLTYFLSENYKSPKTVEELFEEIKLKEMEFLNKEAHAKKELLDQINNVGLKEVLNQYSSNPLLTDIVLDLTLGVTNANTNENEFFRDAESSLKKWGNSAGIRIPKKIIREANLELDDSLILKVNKRTNEIIISK